MQSLKRNCCRPYENSKTLLRKEVESRVESQESHKKNVVTGQASIITRTRFPRVRGMTSTPLEISFGWRRDQAHSGTVGSIPRRKPENEFLDPPVFMVSAFGLPFLMRIGREPDLELEVDGDGPSERRFCV